MKNFSYKDISELAKVSISTVSRYYNGGYVSKNTKNKIESIVKEHNYYPNHGARLIRGHDNSIFVILPQWHENAYTHIISGIHEGAKKHNKKVIITYSEPDAESYIETVKYVFSWKPSSIVFFLPKEHADEIENFVNKNAGDIQTIFYGKRNKNVNWIYVDYEASFYLLTKKFSEYIEPGQKIVFALDTKLSNEDRDARRNGFERACKELNIPHETILLMNKDNNRVNQFLNYLNNENLVNVVCSTHEIFINMISSPDKNLRLTDIGYLSMYDYQYRYKAKIFIDYPNIGIQTERMLFNSEIDNIVSNKIIKPQILSKKN
ncbi:LacI family transcriptional regulator [Mycoplasmopsis maculosa]|uniref:LacI family transcriptional regulator n=2 Tax=Mycoplasmopsis maculosa TaxID=114885 RepID=A0A449B534_9BACT|nr:LacI family transcriptional regulator [Mycoplasmopsis maculosa]